MSVLLQYDPQQRCYRFTQHVLFEAPFADGMAYRQDQCLEANKKIGRKTTEQVSALTVSLTYDSEYYIVKGGY